MGMERIPPSSDIAASVKKARRHWPVVVASAARQLAVADFIEGVAILASPRIVAELVGGRP
jgi:hypothetical protein